MTVAVCDSGPLTHLWQIRLATLFGTFDALHLPEQVADEVRRHVPLDRLQAIAGCKIEVHPVEEAAIVGLRRRFWGQGILLQAADLAVLVLAQKLRPPLVLTDDLSLRKSVESVGLTPMGSVGILLRGYKHGLLNANTLDAAIDDLFVHSTLYLSPSFKAYVRRLIADILEKGETQ